MQPYLKMPIIFYPSSLTTGGCHGRVERASEWIEIRFIEIDAEEHDRVTSQISHFPHILASTLVEQAIAYGEEHEMTRRFAAGGFSGYDTDCRK